MVPNFEYLHEKVDLPPAQLYYGTALKGRTILMQIDLTTETGIIGVFSKDKNEKLS